MISFKSLLPAFNSAKMNAFKADEKQLISSLTEYAFSNISFKLQKSQVEAFKKIGADSASSKGDKLVSAIMEENAHIAGGMKFPLCQDTGVAAVFAFIGTKSKVLKNLDNFEEEINKGVRKAYKENYLRYSINRPLSLLEEEDTRDNTPADINVYLQSEDRENSYFLFIAKGGGSQNKTLFFQKNKAFLTEEKIKAFLTEEIARLGTTACPPYRIGFVLGGLSPEENLLALKLATAMEVNSSADLVRLKDTEEMIMKIAGSTGLGAQVEGRALCTSANAIRLARHGASLFVSIGVSCSSSRNMLAKVTKDGVYVEELQEGIKCSKLNLPSVEHFEVDSELSKKLYPLKAGTLFTLSGKVIVARDKAHYEWVKRGIVPDYLKEYPIFYAGPTETREGEITGSIGPTTSARMDEASIFLMKNGASSVMIGKGERSEAFKNECQRTKSVYIKALGGVAAYTAKNNIVSSEVIDFKEFGMEAVRLVEVKDLLLIR